jgi:uncharacterized membrane protein
MVARIVNEVAFGVLTVLLVAAALSGIWLFVEVVSRIGLGFIVAASVSVVFAYGFIFGFHRD